MPEPYRNKGLKRSCISTVVGQAQDYVMDPAGQLFPPHRTTIVYMHRESRPRLDRIQQSGLVACSLLSILAKISLFSKSASCAGPAGL